MRTEVLENIGLTKSEAKVYLALLELGSSSTGKIVDKSGASSSKIYEILERLMQKGLVSFVIKRGIKYFEAAPPKRILDYLKDKKEALLGQTEEMEKAIPELESKQMLAKEESVTTVFKGMKGAATAFNDITETMNKGEECVAIGFSEVQKEFQEFLIKFHSKRSGEGIKFRAVFGEGLRGMGKEINSLPHTKIRYYPAQKGNPVAILIYKDKTLISLAMDYVWILIENSRLADSFRDRFEELWNQDTIVGKGWDAFRGALFGMIDEIEGGNYDILGATVGTEKSRDKYSKFFQEFHKYRVKKNVKTRLLFYRDEKKFVAKNIKNIDWLKKGEIKFLDYKQKSPVQAFTFKNKVILSIQEEEPTVITINNARIAESFQRQFDFLWKQEVFEYKGRKAVFVD